jgi:hypothetical protein
MEYNITGKITLDDFIALNKFYLKTKYFKGWRKVLYIFFLVIFIMGILIGPILDILGIFVNGGSINFANIITGSKKYILDISPIIFGLVFIIIYLKILLPNRWKKNFESNKISLEEHNYIINENMIKIRSESENIILRKENINKIHFNKNAVYIFIALSCTYIIPSKFFNDNEFKNFKKFIDKNYDVN